MALGKINYESNPPAFRRRDTGKIVIVMFKNPSVRLLFATYRRAIRQTPFLEVHYLSVHASAHGTPSPHLQRNKRFHTVHHASVACQATLIWSLKQTPNYRATRSNIYISSLKRIPNQLKAFVNFGQWPVSPPNLKLIMTFIRSWFNNRRLQSPAAPSNNRALDRKIISWNYKVGSVWPLYIAIRDTINFLSLV